MSDWTELTETHGISAGDPDAIDKLIDRYSESDSEPTGPKCILSGKVCPPHDSGFVFDVGHNDYYIALGIIPIEWNPEIHPKEIEVPMLASCWEDVQFGDAKKRYHIALREWYLSQNKEE